MYYGKYSLLNEIKDWRLRLGVSRGCVYRICLWPVRRDDHSCVLIGAGGERHSDWPLDVLANDASTGIDR